MNTSLISLALVVFVSAAFAAYLATRGAVVVWASYKAAFTEQARFNLADMFLFVDAAVLWQVNAVLLVVVPTAVWLVFGNLVVAVTSALAVAILPSQLYVWLKERRIDRIVAQLPDGLLMAAGSMRAGLGFGQALEALARDMSPPLAEEFALVLREQRMGVKLEDALGRFNERVPVQDVTLFVSAVGISREIGSNLAEILALLADTLRRRLLMEGKVKSLTAQGRLQGIVMALMPVGLVGFLTAAYPDTMHDMYHTAMGWAVMAVAAVMEYLGYRMARKITSIDI